MEHKFIQIVILVEGPTEEAFVKEVLAPFMQSFQIWLTPTILNTKIVKDGPNFKGGSVNFGKVQRDLLRLLKDQSIYVTTLFDYYRLGSDFPSYIEATTGRKTIYQRMELLENAFERSIINSRFKAYIQPHEFEGLLFASLHGFKANFADDPNFIEQVEFIIKGHPNPEEINGDPKTAPSKRILYLKPNYDKIFHGSMIALDNGIEVLLEKCPHFSAWLSWMKSLKVLV